MTLTEFLLARIAEDEAVARQFENIPDAADRNVDFHCADAAPALAVANLCVHFSPRRVLAECEAKRRIVEGAQGRSELTAGFVEACVELAAVYADHPDYDPAWA